MAARVTPVLASLAGLALSRHLLFYFFLGDLKEAKTTRDCKTAQTKKKVLRCLRGWQK